MRAPDPAVWDEQLAREGRAVLIGSRRHLLVVAVSCAAFTAIGVLLLVGGEYVIGSIAVGFFGVFGAISLALQVLRPRTVTVTPHGVQVGRNPLVAWDEITGFGAFRHQGATLALIHITPQARVRISEGVGLPRRVWQRLNDRMVKEPALWFAVAGLEELDLKIDWIASAGRHFVRGADAARGGGRSTADDDRGEHDRSR